MQTTIDRAKGSTSGVVPNPVASVVDLFCGAGALSHGFVQEGFLIACGYDIEEACRYPFEANNAAPFVRRDVASIDAEELAREFAINLPRVLLGCAPCQPFSRLLPRSRGSEMEAPGGFRAVGRSYITRCSVHGKCAPALHVQGW